MSQRVVYESRPLQCYRCLKFGHSVRHCKFVLHKEWVATGFISQRKDGVAVQEEVQVDHCNSPQVAQRGESPGSGGRGEGGGREGGLNGGPLGSGLGRQLDPGRRSGGGSGRGGGQLEEGSSSRIGNGQRRLLENGGGNGNGSVAVHGNSFEVLNTPVVEGEVPEVENDTNQDDLLNLEAWDLVQNRRKSAGKRKVGDKGRGSGQGNIRVAGGVSQRSLRSLNRRCPGPHG